MTDQDSSDLHAVAAAYAVGLRQCDARTGQHGDGPRCGERAWLAAVVTGATYDDQPDESELGRRYGCVYHVREALEWAWTLASDFEGGRVMVIQHERIPPSDKASMPLEWWDRPYIAGMPDDATWQP